MMKIASIVLLLLSAVLSFKHGIDAFRPANAEQTKMMTDLGIGPSAASYIGLLSLVIGIALLLPQLFFIANLLNAVVILIIMALSLKTGNVRIALIEVPFLAIPLLLIWLKYPFKS
jgi:hypothetical protein